MARSHTYPIPGIKVCHYHLWLTRLKWFLMHPKSPSQSIKLFMARIGTLVIYGRSGVTYEFDAFPMTTVWPPLSAVFIVTHWDVSGEQVAEHICLKIGVLENLQELNTQGIQWKGHRANCICILDEPDHARRLAILRDITAANRFPG